MNLKIEKIRLFFVIVTFVKNNKKQKDKYETTLKNLLKRKKTTKTCFLPFQKFFWRFFFLLFATKSAVENT